MRKKLPLIITTLGLLAFLTGFVMVTDTAKPATTTTDLTKPVQPQTSLKQSSLTPIQKTGFGILLAGLGLSVFGYRQVQKQKRLTKTSSIIFDFTKADNGSQTLREVAVVSLILGSLLLPACGGSRATITVGEPMHPAKNYNCYVTVTDKNNSSVTIQTTWNFNVN